VFRKTATAGPPGEPLKAREGLGQRLVRWTDEAIDVAVLRGHSMAIQFDRVPQEFGDADPVDEADPKALRREWLRQFRIWADSSPEQLFAIKVGAVLMTGAIVLLLVFVAAF